MNVLSIAKEKTMKRAEIVAARKQCKDEIANILASIRSLSAVPQRVINGSHGMALDYKNQIESAKRKAEHKLDWGTLRELTERRDSLKALLASVSD